MILVIDNYDSFTYNLVQYLGTLGENIQVCRNDKVTIQEIQELNPTHIVISPGPCTPNEAGISNNIVLELAGIIPIFGVCLGCQTIGANYGAIVKKAPYLMHGKTSKIYHHGDEPLFKGIPSPFTATRYHSLVVDAESAVKTDLVPIAWTEDQLIMAVKHQKFNNLLGVQFHPESILTEYGMEILQNFLQNY